MIAVRAWRPGDAPWLLQAAQHSAWETLQPADRQTANVAELAARAQATLAQAEQEPGATIMVADLNGTPLGYIIGSIGPDTSTAEPTGHIFDVWVEPVCRRQGVSRRLLTAMESWFCGQGVRKAKLWTELYNQAALACARGGGYQPEGLIRRKLLP